MSGSQLGLHSEGIVLRTSHHRGGSSDVGHKGATYEGWEREPAGHRTRHAGLSCDQGQSLMMSSELFKDISSSYAAFMALMLMKGEFRDVGAKALWRAAEEGAPPPPLSCLV